MPCEAGSFSKSTGSATCTACTKGTNYQDAAGPYCSLFVTPPPLCAALLRCHASCRDAVFTTQSVTTQCVGGRSLWSVNELWTGQDSCKDCAICGVGKEPFGEEGCTLVADQQCSTCPVGKAGEGSSTKCAKCSTGKFQDEAGA